MVFIETPTFTRMITGLLSDDVYRSLQNELAVSPDIGDLIPGGGGIRKYRFALPGRGKSGGARLIYYWQKSSGRIYMLLAYTKSRQTTLTADQTAILKQFIKELEHGQESV